MNGLDKQLKKFSSKERAVIEQLIEKILSRELTGLDVKKLKGLKSLFRVRKGSIRVIFELQNNKEPTIFTIERRKEDTYKI
jgi:mRNA-degrading endonuclease RelE of RelBE toxin-antitoxin system